MAHSPSTVGPAASRRGTQSGAVSTRRNGVANEPAVAQAISSQPLPQHQVHLLERDGRDVALQAVVLVAEAPQLAADQELHPPLEEGHVRQAQPEVSAAGPIHELASLGQERARAVHVLDHVGGGEQVEAAALEALGEGLVDVDSREGAAGHVEARVVEIRALEYLVAEASEAQQQRARMGAQIERAAAPLARHVPVDQGAERGVGAGRTADVAPFVGFHRATKREVHSRSLPHPTTSYLREAPSAAAESPSRPGCARR